MNLKILLRVCILLTSQLLNVLCKKECVSRDYGFTGTVCVCNATYCDDFDPIEKQTDYISVYESSLSGLRFEKTRLKLNQNYANLTADHKQTVRINLSRKFQKIIGFGGSFTDATGINIYSLPIGMQNSLLSNYFSANGAEYNLCRVPIAGTDFSARAYTYDDVANDTELTHFNLTEEDYLYKIPYIKLATDLSTNGVKLFGCPWSAPVWMKTTGTINNGYLIGESGGFYYQIWANYFVKFLDAYRNNGLNLWGLSIQNQPSATNVLQAQFNTMSFTIDMEREFIQSNLGPTLAQNGYDTSRLKIIIGDDMRPAFPAFGYPSVLEWADAIYPNESAAKYVSGLGFHWYFNSPNNTYLLDDLYSKYPQYFILPNEACTGPATNDVHLGSWKRGEDYALDIIEDLNHYSAGWVDWNMVLNLDGGPNWINNSVDAPIIVNESAPEYYKQPKFYALAHFSKFLSPDSIRIDLISDANINNFTTTAFLRPDNGIVVIAVNTNDHSVLLTIENANSSKVTKEVIAHSMQTYIWWNTGYGLLPHFATIVTLNIISVLNISKLYLF